MVETTRTFEVQRDPSEVLQYLTDFSRAEEWDPGTVSCSQIGSGQVEVGTRWHNVSKFMGNQVELTYELVRLQDNRITFEGSNDSATTTDDIKVVAGESPGSASVTYHADLTLQGVAKLASPAAKIAFEKLGDETVTSLTRALENNIPES